MPDYISDKPVKLTAKEKQGPGFGQDWVAKSVTPSRDGNGRVLYVHGASLPTVIRLAVSGLRRGLQPGGNPQRWSSCRATRPAGSWM